MSGVGRHWVTDASLLSEKKEAPQYPLLIIRLRLAALVYMLEHFNLKKAKLKKANFIIIIRIFLQRNLI